jgi:hypothetical protein
VYVQSTAHQIIHFGLWTAPISRALRTIIELQVYSVECCWAYTSLIQIATTNYIHTTHALSVAEASQVFLRDTNVLPKYLAMSNSADVTGGKPIAVWSQSISSASAVNPLTAFYNINGRKREVLLFYFVPDTRDYKLDIHKYHSRFIPEGVAETSQIVFNPLRQTGRQVLGVYWTLIPNQR